MTRPLSDYLTHMSMTWETYHDQYDNLFSVLARRRTPYQYRPGVSQGLSR